MADNELKVVIGADKKPLEKTLGELEADLKRFTQTLKSATDTTAVADLNRKIADTKAAISDLKNILPAEGHGIFSALLGGVGLGVGEQLFQKANDLLHEFTGGAIAEFEQAERASVNLRQALESVGRTDIFDRLTAKSIELAKAFKYLDNDDINQVFQKLIQLGGLTEYQMNQLIPVIIDLNAKQRLAGESNKSIVETSEQVVKAIAGQGRELKNYGVVVSAHNTETQNLNIVLTTLAGKVKGAGDAFKNSLEGQIASTTQKVRDLQEELGGKLLPLKASLYSFAVELANSFESLFNILSGTAGAAEKMRASLDAINAARTKAKADAAAIGGEGSFLRVASDKEFNAYIETLQAQIDKLATVIVSGANPLATKYNKEQIQYKRELIAALQEQRRLELDNRTIGEQTLQDPKIKTPRETKPLSFFFGKIEDEQEKEWGKIFADAEKNADKYFSEMEKNLADGERIRKVIQKLKYESETQRLGLSQVFAIGGPENSALKYDPQIQFYEQREKILRQYKLADKKAPDVSWLTSIGAQTKILSDDLTKILKTSEAVGNVVQEYLQPAFGDLFANLVSGSESAGQAIGNFLKGVIQQLVATLAQAAALAAVFSLLGLTSGGVGGFSGLFKQFLGGSSGLGGLLGGGKGGSLGGFSGDGFAFAPTGGASLAARVSGQDLLFVLNRAGTTNGRTGG